jgi:hypothetical protein
MGTRKILYNFPNLKDSSCDNKSLFFFQIISQLPTLDILQRDRSLLIKSDWTLLSNIIHAHDTYSTSSQLSHTINNLSTLPVEIDLVPINPIEIVTQMYTSMQSFIRSSPDFRILTFNEQTSLFDRNLHGVTGFYATLFFRYTNLLQNDRYMDAFINIYGPDIMLLAKKVNERLDPDATLIKLVLIIFAFSSDCLIINKHDNIERDSLLYGTFRLLGSQNVYVELLWKYMIYRYGYNDSILRFSRLIQMFLLQLTNMAIVHENNEVHQKMVADVIEKTKQSLIIDDIEESPLWGRT